MYRSLRCFETTVFSNIRINKNNVIENISFAYMSTLIERCINRIER